jgi:putative transposase
MDIRADREALMTSSRTTPTILWSLFTSKACLIVENLALRQQLAILLREKKRPRFTPRDRLFWVLLSHFWPGWRSVLAIASPDTVIRWHRAGFRLFWKWKSRPRKPGRPQISPEIRALIKAMTDTNPLWGAPRIHAELLKLGFDVDERTMSRYLGRGKQGTL